MLVLFNTAYRPGYARNVLRTIFLPVGAFNDIRYTVGAELQISDALVAEIERKGRPDVLVCFGDRFSDGRYTFHPIRKGKLISIEKSGGRAYLTVRLDGHVAATDPDAFTTHLYELARNHVGPDRLLSLTNAEPLNGKDGRYVFWSESGFDEFLEAGEHAWRTSAGQLAEARSFFSTTDRQYVFSKCDLIVNGERKDYVVGEHGSRYEVKRGNDVRLRVHYYYPAQNDDRAAVANLVVVSSDGLQVLGSGEQMLDMPESRLEFPFAIELGSERTFANIDLKFSSAVEGIEVVGARDAVALKIYPPDWWWPVALLATVAYVVGALFTASDAKIAGEAIKAVAVVLMVVALGKKLV